MKTRTVKVEKKEEYTKYEIARIIGARALQISMNAPVLAKLSKEDFERVNYDPLKIAMLEFKSGILPISVKRPYPMPKDAEGSEEIALEEESDEETASEEAAEELE